MIASPPAPLAVQVHADPDELAAAAAAWIARRARDAIEDRGRFLLAVSGGSTPLRMFHALRTVAIEWGRVHLVQVDERVAPAGSPERNFTHLHDALLGHVPIPAGQVYPMPVLDTDLGAGAQRFNRLLAALAGAPPVLDLVQLGLGEDGHVASLVPGDPALGIVDADVAATGPYHGRCRMTLTLPAIDRARGILWLVAGAGKSAMLSRLVRGDQSIPAGRVRRSEALLMADRAAAADLD